MFAEFSIIAPIGKGEQFDKDRDFAAWLGLVPSQYSTGGKPQRQNRPT
jgi:transposase